MFLMHVTGKTTVKKKSIEVDFMEESTAITAHTCSNLLVFPRNSSMFTDTEESFSNFNAALTAVVLSRL